MSIRSSIWIKEGDIFRGIYCHNDGYLKHNGAILLMSYDKVEKINALISLGDISSLGRTIHPEVGANHSFDNRQDGVVVAYHRDRGEALNILNTKEPKIGYMDAEYVYIFDGGSWHYMSYDQKEPVPLTEEAILKDWGGVGYIYPPFAAKILRENYKKVIS